MNAQTHDEGYNGLTKNEPSLPAECYLTETAFQRDLDTIWYR